MNTPRVLPSRVRQTGVTTLVVAMVLLIAATFITFFAAKVGVQEQRMSANDYRYKQGFNTGEALLDRAKIFLASDRSNFASWPWTACTAGQTTLPCGDGNANVFDADFSWVDVSALDADAVADLEWNAGDGPYILTEGDPTDPATSFAPVVLAARGQSDDNSGVALLRVNQTRFVVAQPGPVPPLMAPSIGLGGNYTVVGNPNHDLDPTLDVTLANCDSLTGSGQMLSMWAESAVTLSGSQQTCQAGSFRDGPDPTANRCIGPTIPDPVTGNTPTWNQCICQVNPAEKSPYSSASAEVGTNDDIVQNDPEFPGDVFLYVFGRNKSAVKASAAGDGNLLADCSTLGANSTGLYWITGDCDIAQNATIGSRTAPVILVVEGAAEFRGGSHVWGLVVGADMERTLVATPSGPEPYYWVDDFTTTSTIDPKVRFHGGFSLHGASIVEGDVEGPGAGGTYNLIYDPCVFAAMGEGTVFDKFGPVAGSWNDRL